MTLAPAPAPLRADRDFRRYWAARVVSISGSMLTYVVLPVLVYQLTGSPVWSALVAAAEAVPYLLFGLIAGALADRYNRRTIMVGADVASALVLLSIPAADLLGVLTAGHALAAGFAVHTLFVFFDAANFGALPALAGRDRLAAATSAVYGASTVLELTVPLAGGALVAVVAPAPLLTVDAVSFLGSALLVRAIAAPLNASRPDGARRRLRREIAEGLGFLRRHPVVRLHTVLGIVGCVAFGAFFGQLVPWADTVLGIRPRGDPRLGLVFAAWGVGGLVATVIFPRLARAFGEIRLTLALTPMAAVLGGTVALARHWLLGVALVAAWSVPCTALILNVVTLRARLTPDRLQSRVNTAGRMLSFGLGTPVGALLGGTAASAWNPRAALALSAGVLGLAALIAWLSRLRRYRNDPAMVTLAPEDARAAAGPA